jgi:Holliday junction DNA helicase RuvA
LIGRLTGVIVECEAQLLLLDVGGVGYEVEIPLSTFYRIKDAEGPVSVYTHFVVRQDAQSLYGFATRGERNLFRALIKVNSVGPKTALAALSGLDIHEFAEAVSEENNKLLGGIPGVSKKNADQIVLAMQGKVDEFLDETRVSPLAAAGDVSEDAEAALIALGYKEKEAALTLKSIESPADDLETLIRQALKQLNQG